LDLNHRPGLFPFSAPAKDAVCCNIIHRLITNPLWLFGILFRHLSNS
jgi:hypothetical protein